MRRTPPSIYSPHPYIHWVLPFVLTAAPFQTDAIVMYWRDAVDTLQALAELSKTRSRANRFDEAPLAVAAIARGEFVVVVDDECRENEGDLIVAAEAVTPQSIAFMLRHTSGLICISLPGEVLDRLRLPLMVRDNHESFGTAFTVSVDLSRGVSTGISATDRATTLRALSDPGASAADFVRPGHVFPLRARGGGVLERPGHTEAASDLVRLAGMRPGGVLCELTDGNGEMLRRPGLMQFARAHGLVITTIGQLAEHCRSGQIVQEAVGP